MFLARFTLKAVKTRIEAYFLKNVVRVNSDELCHKLLLSTSLWIANVRWNTAPSSTVSAALG
jgi:hypothetical protein